MASVSCFCHANGDDHAGKRPTASARASQLRDVPLLRCRPPPSARDRRSLHRLFSALAPCPCSLPCSLPLGNGRWTRPRPARALALPCAGPGPWPWSCTWTRQSCSLTGPRHPGGGLVRRASARGSANMGRIRDQAAWRAPPPVCACSLPGQRARGKNSTAPCSPTPGARRRRGLTALRARLFALVSPLRSRQGTPSIVARRPVGRPGGPARGARRRIRRLHAHRQQPGRRSKPRRSSRPRSLRPPGAAGARRERLRRGAGPRPEAVASDSDRQGPAVCLVPWHWFRKKRDFKSDQSSLLLMCVSRIRRASNWPHNDGEKRPYMRTAPRACNGSIASTYQTSTPGQYSHPGLCNAVHTPPSRRTRNASHRCSIQVRLCVVLRRERFHFTARSPGVSRLLPPGRAAGSTAASPPPATYLHNRCGYVWLAAEAAQEIREPGPRAKSEK